MSSHKKKPDDGLNLSGARFSISGKTFSIVRAEDLTGERWDASMPHLRKIDAEGFSLSALKWNDVIDLCAACLVCSPMTVSDIRQFLMSSPSSEFNVKIATAIVLGFSQSNTGWQNVLDEFFGLRRQIIDTAKADAISVASGQLRN